jgi:YfiH family protein
MIEATSIPRDLFLAGFTTRTEDLASLAAAAAFRGKVYRLRQVHSSSVVVVDDERPQDIGRLEADALVTGRRGILLTVWVADCVPVLLADGRGRCAAAVHAGWRGLVGRIIPATLSVMISGFGIGSGDVAASIGPSIGPCCYEVGEDVAERLAASCGDPSVILRGEGRPAADLRAVARRQLLAASVDPAAIDVVEACTRCDGARLFSHRRGDVTARQCGLIGMLTG